MSVRKSAAAMAAIAFLAVSTLTPLTLSSGFAFGHDGMAAAVLAPRPVTESYQALVVPSGIERGLHLAAAEATQATSEVVAPTGAELSLSDFLFRGVVNWGGYKFTYYSQQVLPGGGLNIPGRHVNASGYVSDNDGYIVLAGSAPKGTVYDTPFGYQGKIYDRGTTGNHLDVYIR